MGLDKTLNKKRQFYLLLKRTVDIGGATLGIVVLSPIIIMAAAVTKITSKGPVLFRQQRLGRHEKPFTLYKFRSMKTNAPQVEPAQLSVTEQQSLVTAWGRFMRETSIDELPQLFNILVGDMSFIGPRPSMSKELESDLVAARKSFLPSAYEVKPGLSGYAQIHLKRDHDINKKARDDSYYVQHMSLYLDGKIFLYSLFVLLGFNRGR